MKSPSLDIRQIAQKAGRFKNYIEMVKVGLPDPGFQWYPYDSLGSFYSLADFLTGERRFLLDLIGDKPVLDIGCGDGHIAFFLESLGCKVLAIDNPKTNCNHMRGVRALKAALNSSVEICEQDIDHDFRLPERPFSLAILFGILYHLKNPYSILETLLTRSQYCVLSTRVARFTPSKTIDLAGAPVAYLVDESETNNDATNYWIFTNSGLKRLLTRSGWRIADYTSVGNTTESDPISPEGDERAYCFAEMTGVPITSGRLVSGWHDQKPLEDWRWTERRFSVAFPEVARGSDFVSLQFFLPPAIADAFGALELGAAVNGHDLPTRTYTKSGHYLYKEQIPVHSLTRPVIVEFVLNQALPPGEQDRRELGIVVSTVSLGNGAPIS